LYVTADLVIKLATLLAALSALVGAIVAVYKVLQRDKRQSEAIKMIQEEQEILCYGMRGALQGLIEQGCDGPCKNALAMLDEHLNNRAHKPDL